MPSRGDASGIYLRDPFETSRSNTFLVDVSPAWPSWRSTSDKLAFGTVGLRLESSAPAWVTVGSFLALPAGGRSFSVAVDPSALPPGAHFAEVIGFDARAEPSAVPCPVFRLPITVVKPITSSTPSPSSASSATLTPPTESPSLNAPLPKAPPSSVPLAFDRPAGIAEASFGPFELHAGKIERFFVEVPTGAVAADLTLECLRAEAATSTTRALLVHAVHLRPQRAPSHEQLKRRVVFAEGERFRAELDVTEGALLEVCRGPAVFARGLLSSSFVIHFSSFIVAIIVPLSSSLIIHHHPSS